jgi:SIR2-like domain
MRERIRTAVRDALISPDEADLSGHLALLELSRDQEGQPRIVTTNFDTLFERSWLEKHGWAIASHANSAMPQPKASGFRGVLHLHGRLADNRQGVNLPETDLVLTSDEVAAALLSMPAATLEELLAPATSWLQRRRESLKGDNLPNETTFLRVWDRLAMLAYPQDSGPIEEAARELISSALNDPAGLLAWTLLNDILDQSPVQNGELRTQYSTRLNVAVNADGRPGLLARVLLVGSLANLESIDPSWAATNLVPCLSWDKAYASAMWGAFAGGGYVGTARLFNSIKQSMLEAFARPDLSDHASEALINQLFLIESRIVGDNRSNTLLPSPRSNVH